MKTAMQELIETIDFKLQNHVDDKVLLVLSNLKIKALNSLEKEKKQIEEAFRKGGDFRSFGGNPDYYNETYKN
jgi:hypothetical protein